MNKVKLQDVMYYFDATAQDAVDKGTLSAKYADLLQLRQKLFGLSQEDYQVVMESMRSLVSSRGSEDSRGEKKSPKGQSSLELYDRTKEVSNASIEKISAI